MDLKLPLLNEKDEQVEDKQTVDGKEVIKKFFYKDGLSQALLCHDGDITVDEIKERYDLFMRIKNVDEIDFTPEEIELIKKILPKKFGVLVCGQIFSQL